MRFLLHSVSDKVLYMSRFFLVESVLSSPFSLLLLLLSHTSVILFVVPVSSRRDVTSHLSPGESRRSSDSRQEGCGRSTSTNESRQPISSGLPLLSFERHAGGNNRISFDSFCAFPTICRDNIAASQRSERRGAVVWCQNEQRGTHLFEN